MAPRKDVKKAAEEASTKQKLEQARKRAELRKKAAAKKKIQQGETFEAIDLELTKEQTAEVATEQEAPKRPADTEVGEPTALKKQRVEDTTSSPTNDLPTPSSSPLDSMDAPGSSHPLPAKPLKVVYPPNPVRDAPPFIPNILIPSLEHPSGRPFTYEDSALSYPEQYLRGVLPPKDRTNAKRGHVQDINNHVMKSLISATLYSMELITRNQTCLRKTEVDTAMINDLKEMVGDLQSDKRKLEEREVSLMEESSKAESRAAEAEARSAASEQKMQQMNGLLLSKDEELAQKISDLAAAKSELTYSKAEQERLSGELIRFVSEQSALKGEVEKLKTELKAKSVALLEKEEALKISEEKASADLESQFQDFVLQMQDARNEYFLDGWEAAMEKNAVLPTSPIYRDVPFPNPSNAIPLFSFDRPAQTPLPPDEGDDLGDENEEDDELGEDVVPAELQTETSLPPAAVPPQDVQIGEEVEIQGELIEGEK